MLILADSSVLKAWDIICFRLVADRIVQEGVLNPVRLILEPTFNDLVFVHAFHGPRYPLLLSLNRVVAVSDAGILDSLPTLWYHLLTGFMVGSMLAGKDGWRRPAPWIGCALVFSSFQFSFWPLNAQSVGISSWLTAAVFGLGYPFKEAETGQRSSLTCWLIAGLVLGFVMGVHRTGLALGFVYVVFAVRSFWLHRNFRTLLYPLLGLAVCAVVFLPFGFPNMFLVGGLDQANPVSNALVPYRETWREAFEQSPFLLAYEQFWSWQHGALLWSGALLVGLTAAIYAWRRRPIPREVLYAGVATALVIVVLATVFSDLVQILRLMGQELMIRSPRYRQVLVPLLAFAIVRGGQWIWSGNRKCMQKAPIIAPALVYAIGTALIGSALFGTLWAYRPQMFPGSLPRTVAAGKKLVTSANADFVLTDESRRLIDFLNTTKPEDGFTSLECMPILPYLEIPLRSKWLNPGMFFLLDAQSPEQAHTASRKNGLRRLQQRTVNLGSQLESATGIRNFFSIRVSELSFSEDRYQVFDLRPRLLESDKIIDLTQPSMFSGQIISALSDGSEKTRLPVLASPLTESGDYEFYLTLNSLHNIRIFLSINGVNHQAFHLRAWNPYIPGPHRIRFLLPPDSKATLEISVSDPAAWQEMENFGILHVPVIQNVPRLKAAWDG